VLSNHVIEHVGNARAQRAHMLELRRVLRPSGIGYLAVPNRWMLVEPHYRLAFLSWLPRAWRTPYLRMRGKGAFYDCEPLQMKELESLFSGVGLNSCNLGLVALRATLDIESIRSPVASLLRRVPDWMLAAFDRVMPTLIYRFSRATVDSRSDNNRPCADQLPRDT